MVRPSLRVGCYCGREHLVDLSSVLIRQDLTVSTLCPINLHEVVCRASDETLLKMLEVGVDIEIGDPECL